MEEKTREKHINLVKVLMAFSITVIYFVIVKKSFTFQLAISDDMQMRDILTGGYSGTPDAHTIYIKYVLGIVILNLYKCFPDYNCYGLFMIALLALCLFLIILRMMLIMHKNLFFIVLSTVGIYTFIVLEHIVLLQFTLVASILGMTGIFWLFTIPKPDKDDGNKKKILCLRYKELEELIAGMLLIMCYCVRTEVFLVNLPFYFLVLVWRYCASNDKKSMLHSFLKCWMIVVVTFFLIAGIEKMAYSSPEWLQFNDFNKNRSYQVDYDGYPDYTENKKAYDDLGITKESYELLQDYCMILDDNIDENAYRVLAHTVKVDKKEKFELEENVKTIITGLYGKIVSSDYSFFNYIILTAIILVFFECAKKEKCVNGILTIAFFAVIALLWIYLIYRGRVLLRAGLPITLSATAFAMGIIGSIISGVIQIRSKKIKITVKALFLLFLSFFVYNQIEIVHSKSEVTAYEYQKRTALVEYCNQHTDNFYLVEMQSFSVFLGDNNIRALHEEGNTLSLGGWHIRSPLYYDKLQRYQIENISDALLNREDVFFVVTKEQTELVMHKYIDYFKSKGIKVKPQLVDEFQLNEGNVGQVYSFSKE